MHQQEDVKEEQTSTFIQTQARQACLPLPRHTTTATYLSWHVVEAVEARVYQQLLGCAAQHLGQNDLVAQVGLRDVEALEQRQVLPLCWAQLHALPACCSDCGRDQRHVGGLRRCVAQSVELLLELLGRLPFECV